MSAASPEPEGLEPICEPFYIARVQHHEYREYLAVPRARRDTRLTLYWNKTNQYDPLAIKVVANADGQPVQLGWVPRGSVAQKICHDCRRENVRMHAQLVAVRNFNPPYRMFLMQILAETRRQASTIRRRFDL